MKIETKQNRRRFFRVNFPPQAMPNVLYNNYTVVNLSEKGILLKCARYDKGEPELLLLGQEMELVLRFADGGMVKIKGKVNRYFSVLESRNTYFSCHLSQGIPYNRIHKEQISLRRRYSQHFRQQHHLTA